MLIAVPNCQGRVSPVFDVAARLVLVRVKGQVEVERREVVLADKHPEGVVQTLRELGVRVVICGAVSQGLQIALEQARIRVVPQICGALDCVIDAFRGGTLAQPQFMMPGCCVRGRNAGAPGAEGDATASIGKPGGTHRCGRRRARRQEI